MDARQPPSPALHHPQACFPPLARLQPRGSRGPLRWCPQPSRIPQPKVTHSSLSIRARHSLDRASHPPSPPSLVSRGKAKKSPEMRRSKREGESNQNKFNNVTIGPRRPAGQRARGTHLGRTALLQTPRAALGWAISHKRKFARSAAVCNG